MPHNIFEFIDIYESTGLLIVSQTNWLELYGQ